MAGDPSCRSVRRNQNKYESRPYDRNFGIRAESDLKVKQLAKFAIWGLVLPNGPLPADAVRQLYHKNFRLSTHKNAQKNQHFTRFFVQNAENRRLNMKFCAFLPKKSLFLRLSLFNYINFECSIGNFNNNQLVFFLNFSIFAINIS